MKAHRTDGVSLTFALIFLGVAAWWLLAQILDLSPPAVGWILAGGLILIGVLGLLGALRSGRPAGGPAATETPAPTAPAPVDPATAQFGTTGYGGTTEFGTTDSDTTGYGTTEFPSSSYRTEIPTTEFGTTGAVPTGSARDDEPTATDVVVVRPAPDSDRLRSDDHRD